MVSFRESEMGINVRSDSLTHLAFGVDGGKFDWGNSVVGSVQNLSPQSLSARTPLLADGPLRSEGTISIDRNWSVHEGVHFRADWHTATAGTTEQLLSQKAATASSSTDGVFVGFKPAAFPGDPATHVFLWVELNGVGHAIESGPMSGGPLNGKNFDHFYGSTPFDQPSYGFYPVAPPGAMSGTVFAQAIDQADKDYGAAAYTYPSQIPSYSIANNANCEGFASGLLHAVGISATELDAIYQHSVGVDPYFNSPLSMGYVISEGAALLGNQNHGYTNGGSGSSGGNTSLAGIGFTPDNNDQVHVWFNGTEYF